MFAEHTRRISIMLASALVMVGLSSQVAQAAPTFALTCTGGSIAAGTYSSLTVTGDCAIDSGDVTVRGNVTVARAGELRAIYNGSDLAVGGSVIGGTLAYIVLGCSDTGNTCLESPNTPGAAAGNSVTIGGGLTATNSREVILDGVSVKGSVLIDGGGVGPICAFAIAMFVGHSTIGGQLTINEARACLLSVGNNTVGGNVTVTNTHAASGEVIGNSIKGSLVCTGNDPVVHSGPDHGAPNVVKGRTVGECVVLPNS